MKWKNPATQQFVLSVTEFVLPNGRRNRLPKRKDKVVRLGPQTAINSAGVAPALTLADLALGKPVFVVGGDGGTGQPIVARQIEVLGRLLR